MKAIVVEIQKPIIISRLWAFLERSSCLILGMRLENNEPYQNPLERCNKDNSGTSVLAKLVAF